MRHAEAAARDRGLRVDQLADRASVSPRTLQRSFADHVISVGLLAGGTGWPSLGSSPTDDEVTVGQFEELSGLDIPESATAVVTEPVHGSSVGALRARFTILEADLAPFCGTDQPVDRPFTDEERQTFALPDDLSGEQAHDCESMRTGTEVSRRVIVRPADGEQVRLYVVVVEMPR